MASINPAFDAIKNDTTSAFMDAGSYKPVVTSGIKLVPGDGKWRTGANGLPEFIPNEVDSSEPDYDPLDNIKHKQAREMAEFEARQALPDDVVTIDSFRHLAPTARQIAVEDFAYPRLLELQDAVARACDEVEYLEQSKDTIKLQLQAEYANSTPLIKRFYCENLYYYTEALKSGVFNIDGYTVKDVVAPSEVTSRLCVIMWPNGFNAITDFAKTSDAIAYAEAKYEKSMSQAVAKRKAAQVKQAQFTKTVKAELDLIAEARKLFK
ncbi:MULTISPECIES: hypothetical protein [unclassified Klebsiella]|uniref:hypothetical protein n=1 Tax=unclassified Klebsiella TaxID=2608929 RepID=UPI0015DBF1C5|nr:MULTISPECIES: hypothetical protein [unclassified Klebsiella]BBR59355.1 hypothetical protein WP4W18E05_27230 [Klebsiella sp. WP4-W18-ESBL-05]BBT71183.1 hypothetical protein WP8S18E06_24820 [Klebsiella sp. WP8-S18-ESBL-06]